MLPSGQKRPFLLLLYTLYIVPKWLETTARLLSHSHQAVANDSLKFFYLSFTKKNNKMEFHFDPGEHSLQVSAKSIEESGCGVEWVKTPKKLKCDKIWALKN
jgi:hypothetical protein